ncbi:glutathione peroxidase [Piscinibacterium candidicorallinum]|uniref:Glutathione peroxidase n=1 Tax=Piscinibacterium candidicorallinum TaxID=1793872 RepID=A0ABV7H7K5_9BURK
MHNHKQNFLSSSSTRAQQARPVPWLHHAVFGLTGAALALSLALFSLPAAAQTPAARPGAQPAAAPAPAPASCPVWMNQTLPRLQDDAPQNLCQYSGRVLLIVNTASFCGFTEQYKGLEALHSRLQARGFTVLGFPSNDFGNQEPKSNKEIAEFCEGTFGVKFPMFAKSAVRGKDTNPVFAHLAKVSGSTPRWNFHKYLVSRDGQRVEAFGSMTTPEDKTLLARIDALLAQPAPAR